jgi:pyruvate/2-oxoglutarate dehydrogenase complex dihydrolipoamide acyltransferase (E2) component
MPDVTPDSDDGVLAAWLVEESARFDAAQTIAYVETENELFSVEAGRPGLLLKTLVEPGTRVAPGTPIGILGEPWEQVQDVGAVLAELGIVRAESVSTPSWFDAPVEEPRLEPAASDPPFAVPEPLTVVAEVTPLEPLRTRRGSHAAVLETDDVDLEQLVEPAVPASSTDADALQHHYLRARVRVDRLVALSTQLERPDSGVIDLVVRAVAAAHRQVPQLVVAHLGDDRGASPGIPVSDPGRFGVEEAAAVVPAGLAAALAVGAVLDEPVIDGGSVVPGKVLTLTLSIRPGRVDDAQAARWLAVLVALLERPEWLID